MEKEGPRQCARPVAARMTVAEFDPHFIQPALRTRATGTVSPADPPRGPLGSHAVADQPQCQEVDEPRRHRLHRRAVGPLLELVDHPGPAAQGQQ